MAAQRDDIDRLESLNVYSQSTGRSVPLSQVADIEVVWEPSTVHRRDRLRTVTVESGVEPGFTASEVVGRLKPWLDREEASWGPGYRYEFGGEEESSVEANAAIAAKLPIAAMIIVMLLVAQFNSLRRPLIILLTIPLGLIGVVLGLLVAADPGRRPDSLQHVLQRALSRRRGPGRLKIGSSPQRISRFPRLRGRCSRVRRQVHHGGSQECRSDTSRSSRQRSTPPVPRTSGCTASASAPPMPGSATRAPRRCPAAV